MKPFARGFHLTGLAGTSPALEGTHLPNKQRPAAVLTCDMQPSSDEFSIRTSGLPTFMAPVAESRSHRLQKKHLYLVETLQLRCRSSCNRSMIDRHVPRACQDSTTPHVLARDNGAGWNPCDSTPAPGPPPRHLPDKVGYRAPTGSPGCAAISESGDGFHWPVNAGHSGYSDSESPGRRRQHGPPSRQAGRRRHTGAARSSRPTSGRRLFRRARHAGAELLGVHFSHVLATRNYFTYRDILGFFYGHAEFRRSGS